MNKSRIAIFASGNGSNAEEIIRHFAHHPSIEVALVLTNNPQAYVIERAKKYLIPSAVFSREDFTKTDRVLNILRSADVSHIVLAGFLWLIPDNLIKAFPNIINIHPALLPSFGGKGMFGMKVHEAVRDAGVSETGITIHLVNEHYDEGKIVFQERCKVEKHFSAEQISAAVHALEYKYYPVVIEKWITGALQS